GSRRAAARARAEPSAPHGPRGGRDRPPDRPSDPAPHSRRARRARGEALMTENPSLTPSDASAAAQSVLDAVETAVVGKRESLELVLTGILAGGHVLLEDLPGLGKTLAARSFAQALGLPFTRAQFTPDLLPADLTG